MNESREKKTLLLLYILGAYLLFQLFWWAYLQVDITKELLDLRFKTTGIDQGDVYRKKVMMIIGEGSVFIFLLGLGFWQVRKNITKELRLARMEKTFILSVTHELKTPIAAVKLFLETMKSRKLSEEQQSKVISDALKETVRLQSLTDNILLATRLDQKQSGFFQEEVSFSQVLNSCIQRFEVMDEKNRRFRSKIQGEVTIHGDHQLLQSLSINLIENALKYSPTDSPIDVSLSRSNSSIILSIADQGSGIPESEQTRVFEKFYRLGNEETRKNKGTGLGLYLVKNIVRLHNGTVKIENNTPHGTRFILEFPCI